MTSSLLPKAFAAAAMSLTLSVAIFDLHPHAITKPAKRQD
jgi:hypothetical protein